MLWSRRAAAQGGGRGRRLVVARDAERRSGPFFWEGEERLSAQEQYVGGGQVELLERQFKD